MMVITAGDDRKVKIWDLRFNDPRRPVQTLAGHSHWVWTAKYNPFHDQLIARLVASCICIGVCIICIGVIPAEQVLGVPYLIELRYDLHVST
jgi:hypothetical protein